MKNLVLLLLLISQCTIFSEVFYNEDLWDIESRMKFFNVPGLSLSIITHNQVVFSKDYGNIEFGLPFQAASFSKPLTALAVFKLVEAGLVDLDVDVNRYLKGWKVEENAVTRNRKVTLRLLLSHTAGIHESGPTGYMEQVPSLDDLLEKIHIRYYPGLKRRYSWSGYTIIQKIIEDVTGRTFSDYVEREVLVPLGMVSSSFSIPREHVNGYDLFGTMIDNGVRVYPELAASGLWSTAEDISKFIIEINKIKTDEYQGIVSKESVDRMLEYQRGGWGLGLSLKFKDQNLIFRHSAKNSGFTHYFISRVYRGEAIVIMTNGDNAWKLIMELLHSIENYRDWGI